MLRYAPDYFQPKKDDAGGGAWGSYYGSGTGFLRTYQRPPQSTDVISRMYPGTGVYGDFLRNMANVGRIRTNTPTLPQPSRGSGINLAGSFGGGT